MDRPSPRRQRFLHKLRLREYAAAHRRRSRAWPSPDRCRRVGEALRTRLQPLPNRSACAGRRGLPFIPCLGLGKRVRSLPLRKEAGFHGPRRTSTASSEGLEVTPPRDESGGTRNIGLIAKSRVARFRDGCSDGGAEGRAAGGQSLARHRQGRSAANQPPTSRRDSAPPDNASSVAVHASATAAPTSARQFGSPRPVIMWV